jgi:hypothetical protein
MGDWAHSPEWLQLAEESSQHRYWRRHGRMITDRRIVDSIQCLKRPGRKVFVFLRLRRSSHEFGVGRIDHRFDMPQVTDSKLIGFKAILDYLRMKFNGYELVSSGGM